MYIQHQTPHRPNYFAYVIRIKDIVTPPSLFRKSGLTFYVSRLYSHYRKPAHQLMCGPQPVAHPTCEVHSRLHIPHVRSKAGCTSHMCGPQLVAQPTYLYHTLQSHTSSCSYCDLSRLSACACNSFSFCVTSYNLFFQVTMLSGITSQKKQQQRSCG